MDAVGMNTSDDTHDEDAIEENVPEVCRVCLLAHMIMRDLFVENNVVSLSMKAMSFASVKMLPEDGLPTQVCCDCADKLEAAYEFKLQVEQADNVLRQRYDTLNIKEELFFNEVEVHLEAERGDDVHSLDVDAHYQATVDSLNAEDMDEGKPTLLKDHLALLEVEKLAKRQSTMEVEHKHVDVMSEEAGVSSMLRTNDENAHYLHEDEDNVVELGDCNEGYRDSVKADSIQDADGITAEEHNYIMQQGYTLTRNEEQLVTEEGVNLVDNESVNYLSLMDEDMSVKENPNEDEAANNANTVEKERSKIVEDEKAPSKTRRSKRKLNKRRRTSDEDNYFENLNLSSRLKRTQCEKSEKCYFLCYLCDEQFDSKEILKEHMRSHEEVRRALSLKKIDKFERRSTSPIKSFVESTTITAASSIAASSASGKKPNKCHHCGKEYLYVISFNKHLKKHEKNKSGGVSKESSFSLKKFDHGETEDSSDFIAHDRSTESEANNRTETSNDDNDRAKNENQMGAKSSSAKIRRRRSLRNGASSYHCRNCGKTFSNKRQLLEHSCDDSAAMHKCNTCDREFDGLEKLRRHRSEHVVEGVLSEQDLDDNVYARDFDGKIRNDDDNEIYKGDGLAEIHHDAEMCVQRNRDDEEDDDNGDNIDAENSWHLEVHDESDDRDDTKNISTSEITENWPEATNDKCPITQSKKSLVRRGEFNDEATVQYCKYCNLEFATRDSLREHVDHEHNCRAKTFQCTDCNKIFGNELTLRNHLFATDHKTIIHGQQYDPNKRMKRVAARAAQKIIDKIKTENDLEDYDDREEEEEEENDERMEIAKEPDGADSRDSSIANVQWSSRQRDKIDAADSARKIQRHRNRRRHDYECESCGRKCSSKQSLTKHMEQHRTKEETFDGIDKLRRINAMQMSERSSSACNNQQSSKSSSLRRDERRDNDSENDENSDFGIGLDWPVDSHECATCKKKYSTKKSLLRHQLLHEEPNFECDICGVKFYRKDKLKSHYDKCSEKNPDQVRKCNICGDIFENNDILKEHRSRHVDEGILTEEDLRDIEPRSDDRRECTKVVRKRRTDIVGLECTECNKRYTSRKGLLRHIQVHEGKKYLCDICPKKFYRREHLKIHVAKHNMIKPYKCPRCTKRFIKEEQLSNHLSKHDRTFKKPKETDTSKRFLCEICSKSFTQSTTLIAHLRAHNGIKPYVCEVCARPFTTNAYLKMHMRTHTQERPYSCQYCSRAFARADTLANHLTSHTGEAKYHCKYCPKNFRRLKSLKEHVFIHTGQRPYACPTCDRRFNNNGSRYAHSKRCKQNHMQNVNREHETIVTSENYQNTVLQPIRLHQLTETHELIGEHGEQDPHMQLVKSQSIKTITIARATDQLTEPQMMQHQEILMPLILPLTVTLTDVDEEVILPEGTKIYTTA